jgi:hypothetical protein
VEEYDGRSAEPVTFDVERSRTDRYSKKIGVDGSGGTGMRGCLSPTPAWAIESYTTLGAGANFFE